MELNETHTEHEQATTSLKVVLLVFAIVLVGALAYLVWAQNTAPDTPDNSAAVIKKTPTTPSTTSTTPSTTKTDSTDSWKTYTNSDYGFTLTFGDLWKGYKVKATTIDSASTITYHFTIPYPGIEASEINDKGYYSILVVSIFTKDEYNKVENKGLLLGSNDKYVFAYTTQQDASLERLVTLTDDAKNVVATFKLTP